MLLLLLVMIEMMVVPPAGPGHVRELLHLRGHVGGGGAGGHHQRHPQRTQRAGNR
jgi:hypothetical protein